MVKATKKIKKLAYMGESGANKTMLKIDHLLMGLYKIVPITYFGMFYRPFSEFVGYKHKVTVLDLACGDGSATMNLGLPANFEIDGVDIFQPYLDIARRRKIYRKLTKGNVAKYNPGRKYDIVMALHVLEHFDKEDGMKFLKKIEKFARKKVVIAAPIGEFPQSEYDDNPYQVHKSSWMPEEIGRMGYNVSAQGLRLLWGNENIVSKYGLFSYFLFFISALAVPFLRLNPDLGTYMICDKDVRR